MSEPIVVTDTVSRGYDVVEKQWTYEELLDLFDDDHNLVKPLVLRCMKYEAELSALRGDLTDH